MAPASSPSIKFSIIPAGYLFLPVCRSYFKNSARLRFFLFPDFNTGINAKCLLKLLIFCSARPRFCKPLYKYFTFPSASRTNGICFSSILSYAFRFPSSDFQITFKFSFPSNHGYCKREKERAVERNANPNLWLPITSNGRVRVLTLVGTQFHAPILPSSSE